MFHIWNTTLKQGCYQGVVFVFLTQPVTSKAWWRPFGPPKSCQAWSRAWVRRKGGCMGAGGLATVYHTISCREHIYFILFYQTHKHTSIHSFFIFKAFPVKGSPFEKKAFDKISKPKRMIQTWRSHIPMKWWVSRGWKKCYRFLSLLPN